MMRSLARQIRHQLQPVLYGGTQFQCPSCGANLRKFLSRGAKFPVIEEKKVIGAGFRKNNCCPVCWATDRERLALKFIEGSPGLIPDNGTILHVGPEPSLCRYFGEHPELLHIRADYLRPKMSVCLDLQNLPLPNESVDLVICNHVLEHVRDDDLAMREIRRVMRPSATAILQVPIASTEANTYEDWSITDPHARELAFGQDDHVRLYGRDYPDRLKQAGFIVEQMKWQDRADIFGADAARFGLNPNEILYLATRP